MLEIGRFSREGEVYLGRLRTLLIDAPMRIEPMPRTGESSPNFRVLVDGVACGVAWTPDGGAAVLNVRLEDPSLPSAVRARMLPAGEGFSLVWRRPRD